MRIRLVLFTLLITLGLSLPAPIIMAQANTPQDRISAAVMACVETEEQKLLDLINEHRRKNSLPALIMSKAFHAASEYHSKSMSDNGYFSHDLVPEGKTWWQSAQSFGAKSGFRGENIAWGYDAKGTFDQWRNSPAHNDNMLNPNYTVIGLGRFAGNAPVSGSTQQTQIWASSFGDQLDSVAVPCTNAITPTPIAPTRTPTPVPPTSTPIPPTVTVPPVTPAPTVTPTPTRVPVTPNPTSTPVPVIPVPTTPVEPGNNEPWCVRIVHPNNEGRWCASPATNGNIKGEAVIDGVPVTIVVNPDKQTVKVTVNDVPKAAGGAASSTDDK